MEERIFRISDIHKCGIKTGHNFFYPAQVDVAYRVIVVCLFLIKLYKLFVLK